MTAAASPARPDQPGWLDPELATLTRDRFSDPGWIFERKLDGERCLAFRSGGQVRLMTRNQKDDTSTYPEISQALEAQQAGDFIIDGEIVAFDGSQTRFARLQQRLGVRQPGPGLLAQVPVRYYVFDVLWADGRDVRPLPLRERKQILRGLLAFTGPLRFTEHKDTDGEAYSRQACASGWEGVIAKRADAPYRAGRTRDWLKFKCEAGQEFVIGGFTAIHRLQHTLDVGTAGALRGDERQHISGPDLIRRPGNHREEHLQVIRGRQHGIRPGTGRPGTPGIHRPAVSRSGQPARHHHHAS